MRRGGLTEVQATRRDPAEFVTLHWKSVEWLREAIRSGEIQDRVVVAAVSPASTQWLDGVINLSR